jgi:hypothetical protein
MLISLWMVIMVPLVVVSCAAWKLLPRLLSAIREEVRKEAQEEWEQNDTDKHDLTRLF